MGVVWHTLTWVNEKGETVFDPSATGDEAECQRKEIDRLERELLLRGIVMCPRGPILERVRPWTGVLESLERFQSARRRHYARLVEVMKGSSRLSHWPGVGVSGRKPQVRNGVPPSDLF